MIQVFDVIEKTVFLTEVGSQQVSLLFYVFLPLQELEEASSFPLMYCTHVKTFLGNKLEALEEDALYT